MSGLPELGLRFGDQVRFRRKAEGRWLLGVAVGREKDGSLGVRDAKGAARAIPIELVEVRTRGPRGALTWEPLPQRAARTEQMKLL